MTTLSFDARILIQNATSIALQHNTGATNTRAADAQIDAGRNIMDLGITVNTHGGR